MKKILLAGSIVLVAAGCTAQAPTQSNSQGQDMSQTPTQTQTQTQTQMQTDNSDANKPSADVSIGGDLHQYTSYKLGVTFKYLQKWKFNANSTNINSITENGNTIQSHVQLSGGGFDGQSVTIYKKDPNLSLRQAIAQQFSVDTAQCDIQISDDNRYPPSYQIATIGDKTGKYSFPDLNPACSNYQASNYVAYFLMDTQHPGEFAWVNVGQDVAVPYDSQDDSWTDTIRFR